MGPVMGRVTVTLISRRFLESVAHALSMIARQHRILVWGEPRRSRGPRRGPTRVIPDGPGDGDPRSSRAWMHRRPVKRPPKSPTTAAETAAEPRPEPAAGPQCRRPGGGRRGRRHRRVLRVRTAARAAGLRRRQLLRRDRHRRLPRGVDRAPPAAVVDRRARPPGRREAAARLRPRRARARGHTRQCRVRDRRRRVLAACPDRDRGCRPVAAHVRRRAGAGPAHD